MANIANINNFFFNMDNAIYIITKGSKVIACKCKRYNPIGAVTHWIAYDNSVYEFTDIDTGETILIIDINKDMEKLEYIPQTGTLIIKGNCIIEKYIRDIK